MTLYFSGGILSQICFTFHRTRCDISSLIGFYCNLMERNKKEMTTSAEIEPDELYASFLFGLRSARTKEKCIGRLRMFFDFLEITPDGSMEDRTKIDSDLFHLPECKMLLVVCTKS